MERMKTFFIYVLIILAFFVVTFLIQLLAFATMYTSIKDNGTVQSSNYITLDVAKIKATNVNGFINLNVTNNSNNNIQSKFIKIELIDSQKLIAATKYVPLADIKNGETYNYRITFKANEIESYNISIVDEEIPYEPYIIDVFGLIEIDTDNLVMKVGDTAKKLPDFVYAFLGIFVTIRTGEWLWFICLVM